MESKLSKWLEYSSKILQHRILKNDEKQTQCTEELGLRRELISEILENPLKSRLTEESIIGYYQIVGVNSEADLNGYLGILNLQFIENKIQAIWSIENSEITHTGYGLLLNNVLSLNFTYESEGQEYSGIVSCEFISQSIFSGTWVEGGNDEIGLEFGRKLPVQKDDPLRSFGIN